MGVDILGFAYAATVAAGGVMGYAKAGSIPSLGAGIIFGSILEQDEQPWINARQMNSALALSVIIICCASGGTWKQFTYNGPDRWLRLGAYQLSQDASNYQLMLGTTSVLGGLMGYRFYNSRKFMPAGLVFCLSVGMFVKLIAKNVNAPNRFPIKFD